jgi:activator of HSP90 ATPase
MTDTIRQEVVFNASPKQIYELLTDKKLFGEMTGAPTEIEPKAGGSFSCFGGMIFGRNIELVPGERVVQAWRVKLWAEGIYSIAQFNLKAEGPNTRVTFEHKGFPEENGPQLADGWKSNYWDPMEKLLAK